MSDSGDEARPGPFGRRQVLLAAFGSMLALGVYFLTFNPSPAGGYTLAYQIGLVVFGAIGLLLTALVRRKPRPPDDDDRLP